MRPAAFSIDNAGFTLVEALAAVLLMSVIMTALAAVTAQWLPGWERGIWRLQQVEKLSVGLDRLVDDIAAAEIVSPRGTNATPLFDGNELSLVFVRETLNPNASGGLEIVRLAESSDDRGPVLVRSTTAFTPDVLDTENGDAMMFANPVAMLRGPYGISFSYAGSDRKWLDTWRHQATLPRAVRAQLRDLETSATLAVSTTTLIHAEVSPGCVLGKTTAQCPELAAAAPAASTGGGVSGTQ